MGLLTTAIIIVFGIFALSRVLLRFKESKFSIMHLMFWIVIWGSTLVVAIFPYLLTYLNINLLVYFSIILLLYLSFRSYVGVVENDARLTKMVRYIAITRARKKR